MAIRIKRSSGDTAPATLDGGQLAYVEGATNGGTLYYGEIGGTVRAIAGKKYIDKLAGIEAGAQVNAVTTVAGRTGAVTIGVADVSGAEATANKGAVNGYASLDSSGLVPSTQLPSYVDDVLEYSNLAGFPGTGTSGKIYVAIDTGKTYRWSGSVYVEISASPGSTDSVTEGSTNLYFTNSRARQSISVSQNLTYDNSTGVITGPSLTGYALTSSLAASATTDTTSATNITSGTLPSARLSGSYTGITGVGTLSAGSVPSSLITGLATVATTGAYSDLTGKPSLFDGAYASLTGKPTSITSFGITDGTAGQVLTTNGSGAFTFQNATGGLADVVDDTTPQLGGDLDVNGKKLVTVSNGGITLAPNGSGAIVVNEAGTGLTVVRRSASTGTASNALSVQRNYTADTLANMDGHMAALSFSLRDSTSTQSFFARAGGEYATSGDHSFAVEFSANNFTSSTRALTVAQNTVALGPDSGTTSQTITSVAVQNLVLNTNLINGNVGGSITIVAGANGNVEIAPNGTGKVKLSGLSYPSSDGTAGQLLKTNGSGVLSFTSDIDDGTF
jgi:hypothetical protein